MQAMGGQFKWSGPPSPNTTGNIAPSDRLRESEIRILLADDHVLIRQGIKILIESHTDLRVVAEASNGQQAVDLAKALRPDVVLMDVNLPILDGMTATSEITRHCPETAVIGLSVYDDPHIKETMQLTGATGFVSKGSVTEELYQAIEQAIEQRRQKIAPLRQAR